VEPHEEQVRKTPKYPLTGAMDAAPSHAIIRFELLASIQQPGEPDEGKPTKPQDGSDI